MQSSDVLNDFSFYSLFLKAEKNRWNLSDIDWTKIDKSKVLESDISIARHLAWTEVTTLSATSEFLNKYHDDLDFSQWLCIWFYEESKHPFVLMKWLEQFGEKFDSSFITTGREIHPMRDSKIESLAFNIISELTASKGYGFVADLTEEPILKSIYQHLSADEYRHAMGFVTYAKNSLEASGYPDSELIRILQILKFSLLSKSQRHPVQEALKQIKKDLFESKNLQNEFLTFDSELESRILKTFSHLTNLKLSSSKDLEVEIIKIRQRMRPAST